MQGITVSLNCFSNCLCQFSISFQEVQCGFWTEAPAAFAIFQLLFFSSCVAVRTALTSCCIQRGSPQSYIKACDSVFCLAACYWSQPRSRCPLSAHFRVGGGVLLTGRHDPRRAARVQENEMSPRRSLTGFQLGLPGEQMPPLNKPHFLLTVCSASQSAPLLQLHSTSREEALWSNPTVSLFSPSFWDTRIHTSAQFCQTSFKKEQIKAAEV